MSISTEMTAFDGFIPPTLTDPATFHTRATDTVNRFPQFQSDINQMSDEINATVTEMNGYATSSAGSASSASASAGIASAKAAEAAASAVISENYADIAVSAVAQIEGGVDGINTINVLRSIIPAGDGQHILVFGCENTNDGGGGEFVFDASSISVDNGGTVVKPNSIAVESAGRWHRLTAFAMDGVVHPYWFEGTDLEKLNKSIELNPKVIEGGDYNITITSTSRFNINPDVNEVPEVTLRNIKINVTSLDTSGIVAILVGDGTQATAIPSIIMENVEITTTNAIRPVLVIGTGDKFSVNNCKFISTYADQYAAFGISFNSPTPTGGNTIKNVIVTNSLFDNVCGTSAVGAFGVENIHVANNIFKATASDTITTFPNYPVQVYFEPGSDGIIVANTIDIPACGLASDNFAYGIYQGDGAFNRLSIIGNIIKGTNVQGVSIGIKTGSGVGDMHLVGYNNISLAHAGILAAEGSRVLVENNQIDDVSLYGIAFKRGTYGVISGNNINTSSATTANCVEIGDAGDYGTTHVIDVRGNTLRKENTGTNTACVALLTYHPSVNIYDNTLDSANSIYVRQVTAGVTVNSLNAPTYNANIPNDRDNILVPAGVIPDMRYGFQYGAIGFQTGYAARYVLGGSTTAEAEVVGNISSLSSLVGQFSITNQQSGYSGRLMAALRAYTSSANIGRSDVYIIGANSSGVEQAMILGHLGEFYPSADNTITVGKAANRVKEYFGNNGTINTSDEREKTFIDGLSELEVAAALEIKASIRKFKWNDAIEREELGGKKARIHIGVGAQTVVGILEKHGLNPVDYSFVCYDEWEREEIVIPSKDAVIDENGEVTQEAEPEMVKIIPAGNRYGIRYNELAMFIIAAI